ncbi:MAG: 2-dehydro-3-deoxy-6-phosphogalactonate aldolase [Lentisphaerae bacterium]|jgi:2-dehydro-3-deoxyphosphogalactonate aldolase|nr:2-dehydro-3-deoxy-6-phosphogalactonate aldolase [Lentisphaerota bacterium]
MTLLDKYLAECPVIAILRGIKPEEILAVCDVLAGEGIRLIEVPLNSPEALRSIGLAAAHYHGGSQLLIGAGTVLTPIEVEQVAQAGGKYIISPNCDAAVIRRTVELGLVSIPGFLTPTEGFVAAAAGAHYLKLFPAGSFGVGYVKDIKAVLKAPILAVGGVNSDNLGSFLAQCAGAGIGSSIYKPGKSLEQIRQDARALLAALPASRNAK